ncbi:MAG TPA: hypothetical protein VGD21_05960 [Lysobacter sp.]
MTEHGHSILVNGNYQVVALTPEEALDPDRVLAYGVWTLSGVRIRRELSLDDARAWMDRLVAEEQGVVSDSPPRMKPKRPRR